MREQSPITARLGVTDYIETKLKSGIETLQEILKEKHCRPYLTNLNFAKIFYHCPMHFWATKTPKELRIEIVKKVNSKFSSNKPICVENATEFPNDNMICSSTFATDVVSWLFQLHPKRNTFLLIRRTNSGKSHFARLIEQCIPFVKRIVKDSVFSQNQLKCANVGLWEEPTKRKAMFI
jgi:hypothetical protein